MTHTLHRFGVHENLEKDYVVFAISAQTVNAKGTAPQFARFFEMALKYDPVNVGDMKTGNMYHVSFDDIRNNYRDNSIVHAVYTDKDSVVKLLRDLSEANMDVSIVVSGLLEETAECCHNAGIKPHTVEYSMGIWGNRSRLPSDDVLQLSTMCGHGMISFNIILDLVEKIKAGKLSAEEAGKKLASLCHCGVFNPARATEILEGMAK